MLPRIETAADNFTERYHEYSENMEGSDSPVGQSLNSAIYDISLSYRNSVSANGASDAKHAYNPFGYVSAVDDKMAKRASLPVTHSSFQSNDNSQDRRLVSLDPFSTTSQRSTNDASQGPNLVEDTKRMTISNFNNFTGFPSTTPKSSGISGYMAKKQKFYSPQEGNCLQIDGTCN